MLTAAFYDPRAQLSGPYVSPSGLSAAPRNFRVPPAKSAWSMESCRDLHRRPPVVKLRALSSAPRAVAYWLGVAGAPQRNNGCARILMFHGTPRNRARQLERVLRYLRRQFDVVSLGSLTDTIDSPTAPLRRKVVLTFDDGLRNNVEIAYPILARLGLPATFFVCPGLVERGQWLWNHEARQRLQRLPSLEEISGA